ncbi:MAG: hypothetical protein ACKOXF_12420 [Chitinophagaceae bacterium]
MMFKEIDSLIKKHLLLHEEILPERKKELDEIAEWIHDQLKQNKKLDCIVICTHNSRRSHLGQLMLALASEYYGIEGISAYSGGTEATAFNIRMVDALKDVGFEIQSTKTGENPFYNIKWGDNSTQELKGVFSKNYAHEVNPQSNFMAILVCDSADRNCPVVLGASKRISLPYKDPKEFDNTKAESEAYKEKIFEMGREFFYLINRTPSRSKTWKVQKISPIH